ncbi:MAG: 50S ribosomal protein L5 [Patescibacteria group bacterium]
MKSDKKIINVMALPKVEKVVVNIGLGRTLKDEKFLEIALRDMALITGQKLKTTLAKKSIANFKTREGMVIGAVATLRGQKMRDFITRLVKIALPRTRDFRGIDAKSIDKSGNLTIGVKEHIVFSEIKGEEVRNIFGFEITIVVKAKNKEEALALYKTLGFPIK